MKYLLSILAVFVLASCSSKSTRAPSSTNYKGRHFVITLHGLRGNAETYGDFHQIIQANLEKIDPTYKVEVFNWTYAVGAKVDDPATGIVWNPHSIGQKFNQDFITGPHPLIPDLQPEDKISLIAYSMGGQMAMTWYYDSMFNYRWHPNMKFSDADSQKIQRFMGQVENIIGLGSVFWGSLDSEFGWSIFENGSLEEVRRGYPKFKALCESPGIKEIVDNTSLIKNITASILGTDKDLSIQEKNEKFVKSSVAAACDGVNFLGSNSMTSSMKTISPSILSTLTSQMIAKGNVSPHELDHMRLTSDVTTEMRLGRISHLLSPELRSKFKTKWTSIVGVFPVWEKKTRA